MSDPNDPLAAQQGRGGTSNVPPLVPDISKHVGTQELIAGGAASVAALLLAGKYHTAAHLFTNLTFIKPLPTVPFFRPTLPLAVVLYAPPPLGFGEAEGFGLRRNYLRRTLERDIGIPPYLIPTTKYLATEKDSPEIDAAYYTAMNKKLVQHTYTEGVFKKTVDQLQSDYSLYVRAARGEFGPLPPNFPAADLADAIRRAHVLKQEHVLLDNDPLADPGAVVRLGTFPQLREPSPLPQDPPAISVGGGGDYGSGGGDPLKPTTTQTTKVGGGGGDPLQAGAVSPTSTQQLPGIPNALLQEANRRAPPLLKELLTERTDP